MAKWPGPILLAGLLYSIPLIAAQVLSESWGLSQDLGSEKLLLSLLSLWLVAITLAGPGAVGIARCFLQAHRSDHVAHVDALIGFKHPFSSLILALTFLSSLLASILALCIGLFIFGGIYMGAPAAMAAQPEIKAMHAMKNSRLVFQKYPWQATLYFFPCFIVLASGYFFHSIVHLITAPIAIGAMTLAYLNLTERPRVAL